MSVAVGASVVVAFQRALALVPARCRKFFDDDALELMKDHERKARRRGEEESFDECSLMHCSEAEGPLR